MISEELKAEFLKELREMMARVLEQAGLDSEAVNDLINNRLASETEAIDSGNNTALVTPSSASLMASKVLSDNVGDANTDLNTIEKIAAVLGDANVINDIANAISNKANAEEVAQAMLQLEQKLMEAISGSDTPIFFDDSEHDDLMSTNPEDWEGLEPVILSGKASLTRLELADQLARSHQPSDIVNVEVSVTVHSTLGAPHKQITRVATIQGNQYVCVLDPTLANPNMVVRWKALSNRSNLIQLEQSDTLMANLTNGFDSVAVAESETKPSLAGLDVYQHEVIVPVGRNSATAISFAIHEQTGKWYVVVGQSNVWNTTVTDFAAYVVKAGGTILAEGTFIDTAHEADLDWRCTLIAGDMEIDSFSTGWKRTNYGQIALVAGTRHDQVSLDNLKTASVKLDCRNRVSGEMISKTLAFMLSVVGEGFPESNDLGMSEGIWDGDITSRRISGVPYGNESVLVEDKVQLMCSVVRGPRQHNDKPDGLNLMPVDLTSGVPTYGVHGVTPNVFDLVIGTSAIADVQMSITDLVELYDVDLVLTPELMQERTFRFGLEANGTLGMFEVDGLGEPNAVSSVIGTLGNSADGLWQTLTLHSRNEIHGLVYLFPSLEIINDVYVDPDNAENNESSINSSITVTLVANGKGSEAGKTITNTWIIDATA